MPKQQASRLPVIFASLAVLILAVGFALYQWDVLQNNSIPVTTVPVAVAPPVVEEVPEPENAVRPEPPLVEPPQAASLLQALDGSLRMAETLNQPQEAKSVAKPVTTPERPAAETKPLSAERSKALEAEKAQASPSAVVPQQSSAKSVKPPMIERTDAVGSPRERAEADYRKAINAVNQGRVNEALDGLRNVLRQDGLHSASRQLLVRLLLEAKRPEEAMQVLQEGLQGQPAQLGWAMSLARLQMERGDLIGAWKTLDYSEPAAGNNADYLGFSAHVLQRLGRNKEAAEHYQAAARLSPGDGRWWLGLGLALEAEGRSSEAREAFLHARQSGNLSAELSALIEQKLR